MLVEVRSVYVSLVQVMSYLDSLGRVMSGYVRLFQVRSS